MSTATPERPDESPEIGSLTLAQQFEIKRLTDEFKKANPDQQIKYFTDILALSMRKENMYKHMLKGEIDSRIDCAMRDGDRGTD